MVLSILLVFWLAGRIYRRSALRFGTPMKLSAASHVSHLLLSFIARKLDINMRFLYPRGDE
jgi:hypothetical protein